MSRPTLSNVEYKYSEPLPVAAALLGRLWGEKLELQAARASTEAREARIPKSVTEVRRLLCKFGRPSSEAAAEAAVYGLEGVEAPQELSTVAQVERELRRGRRKELFIVEGTLESVEVLVIPWSPALYNKDTVETPSPVPNRRGRRRKRARGILGWSA